MGYLSKGKPGVFVNDKLNTIHTPKADKVFAVLEDSRQIQSQRSIVIITSNKQTKNIKSTMQFSNCWCLRKILAKFKLRYFKLHMLTSLKRKSDSG
jgi:hypothetical protein